MGAPRFRHAVLTGAPGAGKTTLLEAAAADGIATSPEVARELLRQPGGMALRENDPLGFAEAMLAALVREYEAMECSREPVVFDRRVCDVVGFLDVSGLPVPNTIERTCRTLRYAGPVLRAPAWQAIYAQDPERFVHMLGGRITLVTEFLVLLAALLLAYQGLPSLAWPMGRIRSLTHSRPGSS